MLEFLFYCEVAVTEVLVHHYPLQSFSKDDFCGIGYACLDVAVTEAFVHHYLSVVAVRKQPMFVKERCIIHVAFITYDTVTCQAYFSTFHPPRRLHGLQGSTPTSISQTRTIFPRHCIVLSPECVIQNFLFGWIQFLLCVHSLKLAKVSIGTTKNYVSVSS